MPDTRDVSQASGGVGVGMLSLFAEGFSSSEELERLEFILQNVYSNLSKSVVNCAIGANTINIPAGTSVVLFGAVTVPNTNAITFKQDSGSTAMPLNPSGIMMWCPAVSGGLTSFILTVSTAITPIRFLFW
jgi:hypothetical protein